MEIRRVLQGENIGFSAVRPGRAEKDGTAGRPCADRVELSRQWAQEMEEQRTRLLSALSQPAGQDKPRQGSLFQDLMDYAETEKEKLDALSEQLEIQQKCQKIAARIMAGKRVPPEDERYLMEHDPEGYKLTMAMRRPPKDDKECESVLDEEDRNGSDTSGETAPADAPSGGGAEE